MKSVEDEKMFDEFAALLQAVGFVLVERDDRIDDSISVKVFPRHDPADEGPDGSETGDGVGPGDKMLGRRQGNEQGKEDVGDPRENAGGDGTG